MGETREKHKRDYEQLLEGHPNEHIELDAELEQLKEERGSALTSEERKQEIEEREGEIQMRKEAMGEEERSAKEEQDRLDD